ncbi:MAG: metallophosphoesterase family protein [Bacteroidetes bacterium]|nr:metallophosphoesterase family protein [Bacteroidota bacterium]MBP6315700.1 metallophosphoesterase family protein [Chitinophagaceae bacterium]
MTKIGLLSDTHSYLPPQVREHFAEVDEIWHAGDIGSIEVADTLEKWKPTRFITGNIDGHELRARYPDFLFFQIENVPVLMTHIGGYPPSYNKESKPLIEKYRPHLFISGHSHILKVVPDNHYNLLHINPGACGKQGWHKVSTLVRFDVDNDRLKNLEIIELKKER